MVKVGVDGGSVGWVGVGVGVGVLRSPLPREPPSPFAPPLRGSPQPTATRTPARPGPKQLGKGLNGSETPSYSARSRIKCTRCDKRASVCVWCAAEAAGDDDDKSWDSFGSGSEARR